MLNALADGCPVRSLDDITKVELDELVTTAIDVSVDELPETTQFGAAEKSDDVSVIVKSLETSEAFPLIQFTFSPDIVPVFET